MEYLPYLALAIAIALVAIYVHTIEESIDRKVKQQDDLLANLISIAEKQDQINDAQKGFNVSTIDLLKLHAEGIDENKVSVETLAKSDLSS